MINFAIQVISFLRQSRMDVTPTREIRNERTQKSDLKLGGVR